ncbi:MAG: ComF family protein [Bdellovibrionota bacterium]
MVFFKCAGCDGVPDLDSFPLCACCRVSLIRAPRLCESCGGAICLGLSSPESPRCLRPWIRQEELATLSAGYLLLNPGYRVLKKWKLHGGPLFDRQVLKPDILSSVPAEATVAHTIVPMPQRTARSWELGRSPARVLARFVAEKFKLPCMEILELAEASGASRQAERAMAERLGNRQRFQATANLQGQEILLVDDFMTSGHTLRSAARALKLRGAIRVHAFCLGIRPFRWNELEAAGQRRLVKSA